MHAGFAGTLFPLGNDLDMHAMVREVPELIEYLLEREEQARKDGVHPCAAYAVFRKRRSA